MADSKISGPNPITSGRNPIEKGVNALCVFWIRCEEQANASMDGISRKNETLGTYNNLLAKIGKLDAMMTGKKDKADLAKALDQDPSLKTEINRAIKDLGVTLFGRNLSPDQGPFSTIDDMMQQCVIDTLKSTLANQWGSNTPFVTGFFATLGVADDSRWTTIDRVPNDTWKQLAEKVWPRGSNDSFLTTDSIALDPISVTGSKVSWSGREYQPSPPWRADSFAANIRAIRSGAADRYKNEIQWRDYPLNKGQEGADVFEALQKVKTWISTESNELQSMTMKANAAMQRVTAAMNALSEAINKMFSSIEKVMG